MRRSLLAWLLLPLALVACDDGTGPDDAHLGTYTLDSVNDEPLPFVLLQVGENRLEVVEGSVTLRPDSTASDRYTFRVVEDGVVTTEVETSEGTYSVTGAVVAVTWEGKPREHFTRKGGTLRVAEQGIWYEFRR